VWCSALWEVRGRFVARLGWDVGNRKVLQIVTDGMKLAPPIAPTFLSERDAIVAAAQAGAAPGQASADVADVWAGFAARGIGASATIQNIGTGAGDTRVTEAFDLPNLTQTPAFTVSDAPGNGNGFPESGERLTLTVPLSNNTGITATGVTLQLVGGDSANYGTINNGSTVSQTVGFTVPAATQCGSVLTLTFNVNSSIGPTSFTRTIIVGVPILTLSQNFDGVTAPALPSGWTTASIAGGTNFVNTTNTPDSSPNVMYAVDPTSVGGGGEILSPSIPVSSGAALVSFRNKFDTEDGWDGGVMEISISGGPFQDIITAGGTFVQNGYTATLGLNPTGNSPFGGRNAWTGNSGGYITSIVRL
ncbi:MAG: M36 family metallopeptidase, partial [Pyrinomonadaceae bacterium]